MVVEVDGGVGVLSEESLADQVNFDISVARFVEVRPVLDLRAPLAR